LLAPITAMPGRLGTIPRIQVRTVLESECAVSCAIEPITHALSYPLGLCRPQQRRSERDLPTNTKRA
jgi:hypothetical protein